MATTLPAFFQKNADGTPISFLFKGTSPSISTCKEEEDLLLVCMLLRLSDRALFMDGSARGKDAQERCKRGRGSLLGGKNLQKQYGRGKKEASRIGVEKDAMGS
uniref:Uncharacterized protein n=1 Tax=Populus alba TaxID=43335 RepID=A0A4U5MY02_POPAL|nr:hypothetical protein D5086_0000292350 [Populus alba]